MFRIWTKAEDVQSAATIWLMAISERADASTSDIQAVARVAQICVLFGSDELTAADVAEKTGLNRTTAYRYCASMVAAGILERGSRRGTFALGSLMLQVGIHALTRRRVVEVAPEFLRTLRTTVRMTSVLSVWGAGHPVVALVEEDTSRTVLVTVRLGAELDAAAAQTHVFLAYADDAAFGAFAEGLTDAERRDLRAAVDAVREQGYAVVTYPGGFGNAAAPVFDDRGICATVAVLGASQDADLSPGSPALTELQSTAAAISKRLGGAS